MADATPLDPDAEFITNPDGKVFDVEATHPSLALAKKGDEGWHMATADEIKEYCQANNLIAPDLKSRSKVIKDDLAEGQQIKAAEMKAADEAAATAHGE